MGLFPMSGMVTLGGDLPYWIDVLWHLVLPTITLGSNFVAYYMRLTRASVLDALQQDYIVTARSKGLKENTILFRHALRNALLPIITQFGVNFSLIFSGAILTETVFSWPGIGRLSYKAIAMREYALLSGIFVFISGMTVVTTLLVDIAYSLVDPRIRYR